MDSKQLIKLMHAEDQPEAEQLAARLINATRLTPLHRNLLLSRVWSYVEMERLGTLLTSPELGPRVGPEDDEWN